MGGSRFMRGCKRYSLILGSTVLIKLSSTEERLATVDSSMVGLLFRSDGN